MACGVILHCFANLTKPEGQTRLPEYKHSPSRGFYFYLEKTKCIIEPALKSPYMYTKAYHRVSLPNIVLIYSTPLPKLRHSHSDDKILWDG